MGIWGASKNTKITNGRSTSTQPFLVVSRHSNSTTQDHRSHPQEPKTSIVTPNTIITFRFCSKWVLGILRKIVKYLLLGLCSHSLFYLCQGLVFQPCMTTCRILGKAKIHLTQLSFSDSAACWYLGSLQKK